MVAAIVAALVTLDAAPVLRRRNHAVRRYVACAPPACLARSRRRRMPARPRVPFEGFPPRALRVPGPAAIPAAPVVGGDEGHDRDAERRDADVGQEHRLAAAVEADVLAVDPTAVV